LSSFGGRDTALGGILLCFALAACTPKVQVEAPKEPVEKLESNLNPIHTVPIKDPKSGAKEPPK